MLSPRFLLILPAAGALALAACQLAPTKTGAASATPKDGAKTDKKAEDATASAGGWFSHGALRWPWEKDHSADEAESKDKVEKPPAGKEEPAKAEADEPLPGGGKGPDQAIEAEAKPKKKGWFSGWHWPWQKKPAVEEETPAPLPEPVEVPPSRPAPSPEGIQPRVPEPGLAPSNTPTPRNQKEKDPLSGIGLHPGS